MAVYGSFLAVPLIFATFSQHLSQKNQQFFQTLIVAQRLGLGFMIKRSWVRIPLKHQSFLICLPFQIERLRDSLDALLTPISEALPNAPFRENPILNESFQNRNYSC